MPIGSETRLSVEHKVAQHMNMRARSGTVRGLSGYRYLLFRLSGSVGNTLSMYLRKLNSSKQ